MDNLLSAHRSINNIITSFYPDDEDRNVIEVRSSFSNLNNSNQEVKDFLECISLLTAHRNELTSLMEKSHSATLRELSSELVHPDILGERISWCQEVEKHLRTITENKDLIVYHLQQPLVTNYLTMHYKYHRSLTTLVEELVSMLNNLEMYVRLVEDHARDSVLQRADTSINYIARTMTDLRNTLDNVVALQSGIPEMIESKVQSDGSNPS